MRTFRNRLIALGCLLAFAGLGVLYFRNWVVQKPFAVILFVGDGLVGSQLAAARLYKDGAATRLFLESFPNVAILANHGRDFAVPEAPAAATLLATGHRGGQRSLAMGDTDEVLVTLLDLARGQGRATGLVSNATLTDPALAAFYARVRDAEVRDAIAAQLVDGETPDVLLGGGRRDFLPEDKGGARKDGRDLVLELRRKGYDQPRNKTELEEIPAWQFPKVFGVFADGGMPFGADVASGAEVPSLADMVRKAIGLLQFNRGGYFLVVDAGLIGTASRANQGERMLREIVELDRAVEIARRYAGDNALIVAVAKHAIGGFALNGYPFREDREMALVGRNAQGLPSITWSTGPRGAAPAATNPSAPEEPGIADEPVSAYRETAVETVEDVIAVGFGKGSERLRGFGDADLVFEVLRSGL